MLDNGHILYKYISCTISIICTRNKSGASNTRRNVFDVMTPAEPATESSGDDRMATPMTRAEDEADGEDEAEEGLMTYGTGGG